MADLITIGKAKLTAKGLERLLGVKPSLDIQEDHVRVYYVGSDLVRAQKRFKDITTKGPSDVRVSFLPVITPALIKQYAPWLVGGVVAAFVLGKLT